MHPVELQARRLALGLSQTALAEILVASQAAVSAWENGTRTIPTHVSADLARLEQTVLDLQDTMITAIETTADDDQEPVLIVHTSNETFWAAHPEMDGTPHTIQAVAAARALAELAAADIPTELHPPTH